MTIQIPMPGLLSDSNGSASDRDPATSHEHAPIEGRPTRDPSDVELDEPLAQYARRLWTELDRVSRYLRDQVAGGGDGPLLANATPLLITEEQWAKWREVYGSALSALAGPAGDHGYGEQEALLAYEHARPSNP
jgi:hypothetical protein